MEQVKNLIKNPDHYNGTLYVNIGIRTKISLKHLISKIFRLENFQLYSIVHVAIGT